jgi:two-component system, NtrC family, sensor kinase
MSLKKKIALSFLISAAIIAILAAFEYLSFVEIKKEIRYLEITDTISRKSLQLRRHEKNFFLYSPQKADEASEAVASYLVELKTLLAQNPDIDQADKLSLRSSINEYDRRFTAIKRDADELTRLFDQTKVSYKGTAKYLSLVESTFLEQPSQSADFLEKVFLLPPGHPLVRGLRDLDREIAALRKTGEDILVSSKDLDRVARGKVELVIRVSQIAILIFFPLFFAVGIGTLFFITTNVVKRLMLLINVVESTGKGSYPHLSIPASGGNAHDEVGVLIDRFNIMEDKLAEGAVEIERKNKELIQSKKLAAIGTLAAGVAHELNNPLNNIYLSAQVLAKQAGEHCPIEIKESLDDILGQTERVKRIVGELLEFARGREPQFTDVDLAGLITDSYRHLGSTRDLANIRFSLDPDPREIVVSADRGQMEQVFGNLFANAVDAMQGRGALSVSLKKADEAVIIRIVDTGKGIPREALDKVFEPFFTTKDKGTGLGLAIVYNIIKKHGGDIAAESETGKGTTFVIVLPVQQENPE